MAKSKKTITPPKDYVKLDGSEHGPSLKAKLIGSADKNEVISVTIIVRRRIDAPPPLGLNSSSPAAVIKFQQLSRDEFALKHAANKTDINNVIKFAHSHGLKVLESSISRRSVVTSGTTEQMNKAFGVNLQKYEITHPAEKRIKSQRTEIYRAHTGPIYIPASLSGIIEAVIGLDNRELPVKHFSADPPGTVPLTPQRVAQLYSFPDGDGAGQTIGIFEIQLGDTGYTHADLVQTMNAFGGGLTAPIPTDVSIDGNTNAGTSDAETILDITVSSAIAQSANIAVYFAAASTIGIIHTIQQMIHPNAGEPVPTILSISWGWSPDDDISFITASQYTQFSKLFQDAAYLGITVLISSGDRGAKYSSTIQAQASYPATDPWVTACGGTTIGNIVSSNFDEYVWNDSGATGGGVSAQFPVPNYQRGINIPLRNNTGTSGRGIPDIAGNASSNSGYPLFISGVSQGPVGGTSAVAPLYAGLVARINSILGFTVGFINPALYQLPDTICRDVTAAAGPANNTYGGVNGYPAAPGWDACTGWGSINGQGLLAAFRGSIQDCYFIMEQSIFGLGAVQQELLQAATAVFDNAFYVVVEGFSPIQLGVTPATLNNPTIQPQFSALPTGLSFGLVSAQPSDMPLLSSNPNTPQRFTYIYNVVFSNTNPFPAPPSEISLTITTTIIVGIVTISAAATLELDSQPDPFFAGGSGIVWLSNDIRVFQAQPGEWIIQNPPQAPFSGGATLYDTGNPSADATRFIQSVINDLNGWGPTDNPFDFIATDETSSTLELAQNVMVAGVPTPVYNFAIARVRYNPATVNAQNVRVFFRLLPALSVSTNFDPTGMYRRWSDGVEFGELIPLLGIDSAGEFVSIPCFSSPRVDATTASMDTQTDPDNVQTITADASSEVDAYFGCWLDINQPVNQYPPAVSAGNPDGPFPAASLQTVQQLLRNQHQCIVAEIAFDLDPIQTGYSPSTTGPLAQRNLTLVDSANPGDQGSRRIPNTFMARPTSPALPANTMADELMIEWGNTPTGSTATIYWPEVDAAQIVQLASRMYGNHNLKKADGHTIKIPTGGITYIPIPVGASTNLAGLISIDLPLGVVKGDLYTAVIRQVTQSLQNKEQKIHVTATNKQKPPPAYRRILGAFQITIPVKTKEVMLAPEERSLSILRWIQETIPTSSHWFPVFRRYVTQIAERVSGLGGNPSRILPSANGDWHKPHKSKFQTTFTGKINEISYNCFGDFEGFNLVSCENKHEFKSREKAIGEIAFRACKERIPISVIVNEKNHNEICKIIIHS